MKHLLVLIFSFVPLFAEVLRAQEDFPTVPGGESSDSTARAVLTNIQTCAKVDQRSGTPSGCRRKFKASQQVHVFANIAEQGIYRVNARFELQDSTRRNRPINVEVNTESNWTFLHFWITPNQHNDKFVGRWKATIYVHDEDGHTTEYNTTFDVTEG